MLFGDIWQVLLLWLQRHCECIVWRYMAGTLCMVTEALRVYCLEIHGKYSLYGYRGTASVLFVVNMAGTVDMGTEALRVCCLEIYGRYC